MANPRRKNSKSRTNKRRANYYGGLRKPEVMECQNCGNPKMLHRACPSCGHYRGRRVIEPREVL